MANQSRFRIPWAVTGSVLVLAGIAGATYGLFLFKQDANAAAAQAAASLPEPAESVEFARATTRPYTRTSTAIGTTRAIRSIELRNELPGTVVVTNLETGMVVEAGDLLVELDVAVEKAELASLRAEAELAETMFGRMQRALSQKGAPEADVDRARAQRDMAVAQVQRLEALIEQKRLHAPFRARVGMVDLHPGQYLESGTRIASLQGLDDAIHVDFSLPQELADRLQPGDGLDILPRAASAPVSAKIVALDARVDAETRNTRIRAELRGVEPMPRPGASVRVIVPVGQPREVLVVPVEALRRSPAGNYVFRLEEDPQGQLRAQQHPVTSSVTLGNHVIIESGLEPGQRVATAGSFKLWHGALVYARTSEPAAEPEENE